MRNIWIKNSLLALAFSGIVFAQDQQPLPQPAQDQPPAQDQTQPPPPPPPPAPNAGWRKFGDGQNSSSSDQQQPGQQQQQPDQQPSGQQPGPPQQAPAQGGYQGGYSTTVPPAYRQPMNQAPAYQPAPVPSSLNLAAGTWLTVRTTNPISTDHNQVGDAFSAVLTEPIVVNGFVIARRGQTIQGRVSQVEKAGRVSGTSKLGLELTQVSLVDGQQVTLHSQLVTRDGGTSFGRDAAAIGATTAAGAAIGAGVNGGVGAGVGAAGGLVVSTVGVLLTRGKPAVIYPETVLTFKVVDPITISTANSASAFRPVGQQDYENNTRRLVSSPGQRPGYGPAGYGPAGYGPGYAPGYGAPYPYYAAPYPYYGYGYGPSIFFGGRGYRRW
jgi:hypothetical protein